MVTFKSGDVIFKKVYSNSSAIDFGELSKKVAEDAGAMIVLTPLAKTIKKLREQKLDKPVLHLGVHAGHLTLVVQAPGTETLEEVVVKKYATIKANRAQPTVINAQKGDSTIDSSSERMSKAKGTTTKLPEEVELSSVKGDIIILAHGSPSGTQPGTVYAKEFGNRKPADIVKFLVKDKKLPKSYSGVIYLDGCFTAAGPKQGRTPQELNNFCKKVYDGLKSAGYEQLQVKGNLGVATTKDDGSEDVVDAQMESEVKKATAKIQKDIDKFRQQSDDVGKKLKPLLDEKKKLTVTKTKLQSSDPGVPPEKVPALVKTVEGKLTKLQESIDKLQDGYKKVKAQWDEAFKQKQDLIAKLKNQGISTDKIQDLVGTFGPEKPPQLD